MSSSDAEPQQLVEPVVADVITESSISESPVTESPDLLKSSMTYMWSSSLDIYSALRKTAYDRSTLLNYGFDQFEAIAKKSQPYAAKLYTSVGEPVVQNIDGKVNRLVGKVATAKSMPIAVSQAWLQSVDHMLSPRVDIKQSFDVFLVTATNAYVTLYDKAAITASQTASMASSQASTIVVKYEDFQQVVQSQLSRAWDSRLAQAAKESFDVLSSKADELRQSIRNVNAQQASLLWAVPELVVALKQHLLHSEEVVIDAFSSHVQRPAAALYNTAVDQYIALALVARTKGQQIVDTLKEKSGVSNSGNNDSDNESNNIEVEGEKPTLQSFITTMKTRLGDTYTQQLEQPLSEFFQAASKVALSDLKKLSGLRLLSPWFLDNSGVLRIQDFYFRSKAAVASLPSLSSLPALSSASLSSLSTSLNNSLSGYTNNGIIRAGADALSSLALYAGIKQPQQQQQDEEKVGNEVDVVVKSTDDVDVDVDVAMTDAETTTTTEAIEGDNDNSEDAAVEVVATVIETPSQSDNEEQQ